MKKKVSISLLAFVLVMSLFSFSLAQRPGMGRGDCKKMGAHIPDLTDEQKTKIEDLWLAHQKDVQPHRLQMQKMRIELQELMITEKPDLKKINAKQEEMSKARLEMQKKAVAHRLTVRELLTEKQRIFFDKHPMGPRQGAGFHKGFRGGCQGPNCGQEMRGAGPYWHQQAPPDAPDDEE
jgi:Spy/CpxP family protein refolding chaperone